MSVRLRKDLNCMRASLKGRDELAARVQQTLALATKKEAEMVVDAVVTALEATLLNSKFAVRHKAGIFRRIPFTGKTILTRDKRKVTFVSLGRLRQREQVMHRD